MAKKKKREMPNLEFNSDDFNWCVRNDFMVYAKLVNNGHRLKIAIRRGGISTNGKDFFRREDGVLLTSKERLGQKEFKNMKELSEYLPNVYKQLRDKYEK